MGFPELTQLFKQKLFAQRYSPNSIKTYGNCLAKFLRAFDGSDLETISEKDIGSFVEHLLKTDNISDSYRKQLLGTIVKFYDLTYNRVLDLSFLYPSSKNASVPQYISQREIKKMLAVTENLKHRCIIKLLYGAGLRLNEVLHLRPDSIDFQNSLIHVQNSKGRKDRSVMLSGSLSKDVIKYLADCQPEKYLFEGLKNTQYSSSSVQALVKEAAKRAGVKKVVSPRTLRQSFAIHLFESGTEIRFIQELLGHYSIKSTLRYTQLSRVTKGTIKSPLDHL
ncbi:Site-specific recombinase XerD [Cyclobacterium xiamenense]|uniref:Site-specific recombinase XerD n=1 Tax=Cyclobacterium xiamenense TaxID=1297121 RepID=A0A1H6YIB8_9BACT|nr:tyrosine-type recombinase/integrase [Cyclobacterium xiamenense]SEJ36485.1 Site-specific recombinase XerD [Cyclobacterium xiamenense]